MGIYDAYDSTVIGAPIDNLQIIQGSISHFEIQRDSPQIRKLDLDATCSLNRIITITI